MAEVHGTCDERFAEVREALARQLEGDEVGASVAVDLDGETVVDLWGGYRDAERTTPWGQDTIVNVWSTTKCVLNLAALVLVERGELDVDAPVGNYWPEFSAKGKKDVLVRHLMAHTSGVPGWEQPFSVRDMYDWETACERLAQQRPWWEPGTASGYHAAAQGFLVGEVIRRITNTTLKKFVAEEIAGPLGADFQIGAREGDVGRIASLVAPPREEPAGDIDPSSIAVRTFTAPTMSVKATASPEWRAADLGALNGHSNARGARRAAGAVPGRRGRRGAAAVAERRSSWCSTSSPRESTWCSRRRSTGGIGYCLRSPVVPYVPAGRTFFWGGWSGSLAVMDLDRRLTISYMMNRMAPGILGSPRSEAYVNAVYAAL